MVGKPGIRRDAPTGTELRREGIELLARLNEPVRAVAAGVIRRVETVPQGGYVVVTQHPARWVSVLSGLREWRLLLARQSRRDRLSEWPVGTWMAPP